MISQIFLQEVQQKVAEKYGILESIEGIVPNGSMFRFDSKKSGDKAVWIAVHAWEYKNNMYYKAICGSWHDGTQFEIPSYSKNQITKEFNAKQQAQVKKAQEFLDAQKKKKHQDCKAKWEPIYNQLAPSNWVHPYLEGKQIDSNFHARITKKGVLFVPAWNKDGSFVGGQQIFSDPETGQFIKRYTSGIEKLGSFCPFGDIRNASLVYICEGFATACSVYMAFRDDENIAVIATWDTSNLYEGAKAIREINRQCRLVFAADRDVHSEPRLDNIGYKKAKFASSRMINSIVRMVEFKNGNEAWSDYNDLHQFESLEEVRDQLMVSEEDFIQITPLGYRGDVNFLFSNRRNMIIEIGPKDFTPNNLSNHAPEKFWGDRYGYHYDADGNQTKRMDIKKVVEGVASDCIERGYFNATQIRSVGPWYEQGKVCVNLGNRLFYDGEIKSLFNNDIKSKYFYESDASASFSMQDPIGEMQAMDFVSAIKMLNFQNKGDSIILLGWIFCSQVFAALKWRPHLWVTGPKGSGKSTILGFIHNCIPFSFLTQDSTSAGIRQELKNQALVTIYDESEPNNQKDRSKLEDILTLARQSSTRSEYKTLRGNSSGNAISYNTNTCFCMGSIQIGKMNEADASRFFVIEMNKIEGQTQEDFVRLENAMTRAHELSKGLLARSVALFPQLQKNIDICKQVIKKNKIESRKADQLAPIISGYYAYFSDDEISESFIIKTINEMNFKDSSYQEDNSTDQSEACFDAILDLGIPKTNHTVGQLIDKIIEDPMNNGSLTFNNGLLSTMGIKFFPTQNELFISKDNVVLTTELIRSTQFADFYRVLKRHPRLIKKETNKLYLNGKYAKGLVIKLE